jgi:uncharacterized protein
MNENERQDRAQHSSSAPDRRGRGERDIAGDPVLAELVRRLVTAYQPELVFLFGSRARQEAGPESDYDLLIVVPDHFPAERKRSRLAYQSLRGTGTAADVLVWTRRTFEERLHLRASLPATVVREGTLLYAA